MALSRASIRHRVADHPQPLERVGTSFGAQSLVVWPSGIPHPGDQRFNSACPANLLLATRIGDQFDAIITDASNAGTCVRIMVPPIEGKLERGVLSMRVGQRLRVQLTRTDVGRGFIDFQTIVSHEKSAVQIPHLTSHAHEGTTEPLPNQMK